MGFLPPFFPPRLLGQLRPLLSARPPAPPPLQPLPAPIVLAPSPLLPSPLPPTPLPGPPSFPDASPLWGGGFCAGDRQKGSDGLPGHPSAAPHHVAPPSAGGVQLPRPLPSQRSGELGPPRHHPFPVRANRSAAGAEPPGASNIKECTGRRWGETLRGPRQRSRFPGWGTASLTGETRTPPSEGSWSCEGG